MGGTCRERAHLWRCIVFFFSRSNAAVFYSDEARAWPASCGESFW